MYTSPGIGTRIGQIQDDLPHELDAAVSDWPVGPWCLILRPISIPVNNKRARLGTNPDRPKARSSAHTLALLTPHWSGLVPGETCSRSSSTKLLYTLLALYTRTSHSWCLIFTVALAVLFDP